MGKELIVCKQRRVSNFAMIKNISSDGSGYLVITGDQLLLIGPKLNNNSNTSLQIRKKCLP